MVLAELRPGTHTIPQAPQAIPATTIIPASQHARCEAGMIAPHWRQVKHVLRAKARPLRGRQAQASTEERMSSSRGPEGDAGRDEPDPSL
ncbi:MAG TPA: hypothetical protein VGN34_25500 [Ktedonobacteraceae bacterium]